MTADADVIIITIVKLDLQRMLSMLLFAEADNYRLASSDAFLELTVDVQLVVLAVFADVPVLKPGL